MKYPTALSFSRRRLLQAAAGLPIAAHLALLAEVPDSNSGEQTAPIILDTDIGDDIDDTWALYMILRMPELELKLAVGDFGNAHYRARLLAKLLDRAGRSDVPVGVGMSIGAGGDDERGQQSGWLGGYALDDYPGQIHRDGVQAIIDTIKQSPVPVTLLCLGPVPNIAEALRRDPSIAENAHFVGMHGSIFKGYVDDPTPVAEYNVRVDPQSLQAVFNATWECTITPLDTCGLVALDGDDYQRLYTSDDPWLQDLMANYRAWLPGAPYIDPDHDLTVTSTTLFDAVAVHLVAGGDYVNMESLPLRVTDDGFTVVDEKHGRPVNCAITWKSREMFQRELVNTLLG